ncbi:MAG TPA: hypothetical protein VNE71_12825 [Myxococcota bacterium]|nr:hypothetical protein [Myxococcota bacterium]
MVQLFSLASLLSFAFVGGLVGWRIGRVAKATGREPERWIAICLIAICGIAYPGLLLSRALPWLLPIVGSSLAVAAADVGAAAIFHFTRCVFRPDVAWLRPALRLVAGILVVHWVGSTVELTRTFLAGGAALSPGKWTALVAVVSGAGFAWTAWESFRYWTVLRRRVPLGLADPLVVNRVALWAMTGCASVLINVANVWTSLAEISFVDDPLTMIATGVLGLINAACLFLAFLPPTSYAARIRHRMPMGD